MVGISVRKGVEVTNEEIRKTAFMNRLKMKDIAIKAGIKPDTLSHWMLEELSGWRKELIEKTIADLVAEKTGKRGD